jgi:hypothetical protein
VTLTNRSWDCVVGTATTRWAGWTGLQILIETKDFLFSKMSDWLWGPPTLLFSGYQRSFLGLELQGYGIDHSPPSGTQVKNEWSYTSTPSIYFHGVGRDKFPFYCLTKYSHQIVCLIQILYQHNCGNTACLRHGQFSVNKQQKQTARKWMCIRPQIITVVQASFKNHPFKLT